MKGSNMKHLVRGNDRTSATIGEVCREGQRAFLLVLLRRVGELSILMYAASIGAQAGVSSKYFPAASGEYAQVLSEKEDLANPGSALFDSLHSFDALHYMLILDFPMQSDYYRGSMTLQFRVVDDSISSLRLHSVGLGIDSVKYFADPSSFSLDDTSIIIDLNGYHRAPETLAVRVYYHDDVAGRGYYHFSRNSYTMSEPQDARYWFPCYDEPWDKATSEIYATVPEDYEVGSNGYLANVEHDPGARTRTYHWVNTCLISTYLMNLIMGNFAVWNDYYVNQEGDSIPIFNMVWPEDSSRAAYDFGLVPNMMAIYSNLFYPYSFDKYGQGAVAPFAFGGMEHQTMTTLNRSWITGDRTFEFGYAHELAHMWWGDLVTLSDWRHIWLNEGFATYSSALYNEVEHGQDAFRENMLNYKDDYFTYEQSGGRFPIFNPPDLFALPVYVKGAWVLHMLRGVIGDSAFFDGLHLYAATYAYGNASTDEFRDVMESISGTDLDWFFNEWVFDQGYPEYNYAWSYRIEGDDIYVHLDIAQVQSEAPIFRMPLKIRIYSGVNYDFDIVNDQQVQSYDFYVLTTPIDLAIDPDDWVLDRKQEVQSINGPNTPLPYNAEIKAVYPNPFNDAATILFWVVGKDQFIRLSIYDIQGRLIRGLAAGRYSPGAYVVRWNGRDGSGLPMPSGIYLTHLVSEGRSSSKMLTYMK